MQWFLITMVTILKVYEEHTTTITGMRYGNCTKPSLQTSSNLCVSPGLLMFLI